MYVLKGSNID